MWDSTNNSGKLPDSFQSLVDKDIQTKGSFQVDYETVCSTYSMIKCPYVSTNSSGSDEKVCIRNSVLDLPTWRSVLISCCTIGSKVREIYVHGCRLGFIHIEDLTKVLSKCGTIKILRLQYSDFSFDEETIPFFSRSFQALLQDSCQLEYLSLKGNKLTDQLLQPAISQLNENYRISCLNISDNLLTDVSLIAMSNSIRFSGNIKKVSMAKNNIQGSGLLNFLAACVGSSSLPTDEASLKSLTKAIADKNKGVKDVNKKRKKAGLTELNEIGPLPELLHNIESKSWFANKSFEILDISNNPLDVQSVGNAFATLNNLPNILVSDAKLKLVLENKDIEETLLSFRSVLFC